VPFEEDDKDPSIWFLDHSYLETMFKMFKKVNGEWRRAGAGARFGVPGAHGRRRAAQPGRRWWAGTARGPASRRPTSTSTP
jgi:hypothetical protein